MATTTRAIPSCPFHHAGRDGSIWKRKLVGRRRLCQFANRGYLYVVISGKQHAVHRLVLEAWRGKPSAAQRHTRHIDGDRANNRLANLAWATVKENAADRRLHMAAARLRCTGWSTRRIARRLGLPHGVVLSVVRRRCRRVVGAPNDFRVYPREQGA